MSTAWKITGAIVAGLATAIGAGLSAINVAAGGKPSPPPERIPPKPNHHRP
ncbi:MAG: hypothetical protein JWP75_1875 [Frondihabitans sp.]|nr:hypothetical protein [Frondihabitans sp.]